MNRSFWINVGKLIFLAGWGLALGACMNDASAGELAAMARAILPIA